MADFSLSGTFTYLPDPSAWESSFNEVGTLVSGAPLIQGYEAVTLTWSALTQQQYGELYARWNANKGDLVSGTLPDMDASSFSWQSVTAYFHEPSGQLRARVWENVQMRVTHITRS